MIKFVIYKKAERALRVECDGQHIGTYNSDEGAAHMETVEYLISRIARTIGATVEIIDVSDEINR